MKTAKTARIAVSLPKALLAEVERLRRSTGESRSNLVRRSILRVLEEREIQARVEAYIRGYQKIPETPQELEEALVLSLPVLSEEPWK